MHIKLHIAKLSSIERQFVSAEAVICFKVVYTTQKIRAIRRHCRFREPLFHKSVLIADYYSLYQHHIQLYQSAHWVDRILIRDTI